MGRTRQYTEVNGPNFQTILRTAKLRTISANVIAILAVSGLFAAGCAPPRYPLLGQPAPNAILPLVDGGAMDLAAHKGRDVVVLDFWATWCPPCREAMPVVEAVVESYADRGVVLYAVNQQESPVQVKRWLQNTGYRGKIALDADGAVGFVFQAENLPTTVVIDRSGTISWGISGYGPGVDKLLDKAIRAALDS